MSDDAEGLIILFGKAMIAPFLIVFGLFGWLARALFGFGKREHKRRKLAAASLTEHFLDGDYNLLDSRVASGGRSVGDRVSIDGKTGKIVSADTDSDGNYQYIVSLS